MPEYGKYLYGIIAADEARNFGPIGIGGREVETIHHQHLSAVISSIPLPQCVLSKESLLAHERVLERVMAEYTVLPVKFYTVGANVEEIRRLIELRYQELLFVLRDLEGKVELGGQGDMARDAQGAPGNRGRAPGNQAPEGEGGREGPASDLRRRRRDRGDGCGRPRGQEDPRGGGDPGRVAATGGELSAQPYHRGPDAPECRLPRRSSPGARVRCGGGSAGPLPWRTDQIHLRGTGPPYNFVNITLRPGD